MTGDRLPLRSLGSTGLMVSRIGLGLAALGRPAYINLERAHDFGPDRTVADFEQRCHELLGVAYAAGIRYVDAARSYGMAEAWQVTAVKQQAEALGTTSDALALAAALSQPWVDVVLSGAVTLEQLHSNLNAVSLAAHASKWPTVAEPPAEYWAARSRLAWN